VIFHNPSGAPELACDQCGCRWFDRMTTRRAQARQSVDQEPPGSALNGGDEVTNTCYECGAEVTPENLEEYEKALAAFEAKRQQANGGGE
jgi:DNA-directed RNA polymerase subunit RPC12/RpoP